jgi:hypothetical protein
VYGAIKSEQFFPMGCWFSQFDRRRSDSDWG